MILILSQNDDINLLLLCCSWRDAVGKLCILIFHRTQSAIEKCFKSL